MNIKLIESYINNSAEFFANTVHNHYVSTIENKFGSFGADVLESLYDTIYNGGMNSFSDGYDFLVNGVGEFSYYKTNHYIPTDTLLDNCKAGDYDESKILDFCSEYSVDFDSSDLSCCFSECVDALRMESLGLFDTEEIDSLNDKHSNFLSKLKADLESNTSSSLVFLLSEIIKDKLANLSSNLAIEKLTIVDSLLLLEKKPEFKDLENKILDVFDNMGSFKKLVVEKI